MERLAERRGYTSSSRSKGPICQRLSVGERSSEALAHGRGIGGQIPDPLSLGRSSAPPPTAHAATRPLVRRMSPLPFAALLRPCLSPLASREAGEREKTGLEERLLNLECMGADELRAALADLQRKAAAPRLRREEPSRLGVSCHMCCVGQSSFLKEGQFSECRLTFAKLGADSGSNRNGRIHAEVDKKWGRTRSDSVGSGPILIKLGADSADIGEARPKAANLGPNSANFDQVWVVLVRIRSISTHMVPTLTPLESDKSGSASPKFGPNPMGVRPTSARRRPDWVHRGGGTTVTLDRSSSNVA